MIVEIDNQFLKRLKKIKDSELRIQIESFILNVEAAESLTEISGLKQLSKGKNYYRYRLGNYRIGFKKTNINTVKLIIVAKRNDIYKSFPLFAL